jgi:hypothetical protein
MISRDYVSTFELGPFSANTNGIKGRQRGKQAKHAFLVTAGRHFPSHVQIKCPVGYLSQSYMKYSNLF